MYGAVLCVVLCSAPISVLSRGTNVPLDVTVQVILNSVCLLPWQLHQIKWILG